MKDNKGKSRGIKHKIREEKTRQQRIGLAVAVAILIVIISVSGFFVYSLLTLPPQKEETSSSSEPKAAIVDHLSLTVPNQTFIETTTNILKQAGYSVDYYPGEKVTVEFYRNLPTHGYSLIILRVHSVLDRDSTYLSLFTSETLTTAKYTYELLGDRLTSVAYTNEEARQGKMYFGISPVFVKLSMRGQFSNSTVVMMGCNGLTNSKMAEAFIEKGARVYIGWSKSVLASHTDQATICLLQHLITERKSIKKAVEATMDEVGSDPANKSLLAYYPLEAGDHTIQDS